MLPQTWVPSGTSRAVVTSPYGGDHATTEREPDRIEIDNDHFVSPDVTLTDLGDGRVEIFADMPFPVPNVRVRGELERRGETLVFTEDNGESSAEVYRLWDGTMVAEVHRLDQEDLRFTYRTCPGC